MNRQLYKEVISKIIPQFRHYAKQETGAIYISGGFCQTEIKRAGKKALFLREKVGVSNECERSFSVNSIMLRYKDIDSYIAGEISERELFLKQKLAEKFHLNIQYEPDYE